MTFPRRLLLKACKCKDGECIDVEEQVRKRSKYRKYCHVVDREACKKLYGDPENLGDGKCKTDDFCHQDGQLWWASDDSSCEVPTAVP